MRLLIYVLLIFMFMFSNSYYPALAETSKINNKEMRMRQNLSRYSDSLALQAAIWGLPAVIMYNLRYNDALKPDAKSMPNQIWRLDNITTPALAAKAGYVTPNVNVIYGFGFLDLSQEPIILTAPDSHNRYYMIQLVDMYTNSFAYVGGVATGYQGGGYAIVGPHWKGSLPSGLKRIDAPTPWILIQPRVHVVNDADLPAAQSVLRGITVKGLSEYQGGKPVKPQQYHYVVPEWIDPNLPVSAVDFKNPLQFWQLLSDTINENPPPLDQMAVLLQFKMLGIEWGKPWKASEVSPVVLDSMRRVAAEIGDFTANLPVGRMNNGWFVPPISIGNSPTDYYLRAIIARVGLTANTPEEAIYFMTSLDQVSQTLMSNKQYILTFKQLPPFNAPGFWSLTLYNAKNNYTVENVIHRYSLGSDNAMKLNADGSLTIYLQNMSPGKEKENNWLPTGNGNQPIYLILRSYAPSKNLVQFLTDPTVFVLPPVVNNVKNPG